jgi:hypothetical protein
VEEAVKRISEPRTGDPRVWSEGIVNAAKRLKEAHDESARGGSGERERIERMKRLQENKVVLPRILQVIHEALPGRQGPLAAASTPEQYRQAVEELRGNGTGRPQRREIFIEKLVCSYEPDVGTVTGEFEDKDGRSLDVSREPELDVVEEDTSGKPGFFIRLSCRTPNELNLRFVNRTFKDNLRTLGRRPGTGFYINRVVQTSNVRLAPVAPTVPTTPKDGTDTTGRGRGLGSGRGGRGSEPQPTGPTGSGNYYDPLTEEVMDTDWVFVLNIEVVLEDLPGQEGEEEGEETEPTEQ